MTDDPVPPDQPVWIPGLERHAKAIGYVCIELAELEIILGGLIHRLGHFQTFDFSHAINAHLELKDKLEVVRALGLIGKPSDTWFDVLDDAVKSIKKLCQDRNRIVHDAWIQMDDGVYRYRLVTKIAKPQAHQPVQLATTEQVPVSEKEIWELVVRIEDAAFNLGWLIGTLDRSQANRPPPKRLA